MTRTVFCVGNARLVREVSPLLENACRVRWVADLATLSRISLRPPACNDATTIASPTIACIADDADLKRLAAILDEMRHSHPKAKRIAIVDAYNAEIKRELIDASLADALLYRPLELSEVRRAANLPILNRLTAPMFRSAAPHG